jgi:hypothetical protein
LLIFFPALHINGIVRAGGAGLNTTKQCLPDTRKETINERFQWIHMTGSYIPRFLWLSGPACKGKSAIARAIAKRWDVMRSIQSFGGMIAQHSALIPVSTSISTKKLHYITKIHQNCF